MKKWIYYAGAVLCATGAALLMFNSNESLVRADIVPAELCEEVVDGPDGAMNFGIIFCTKVKGHKCKKDWACNGFQFDAFDPCRIDPATGQVVGECKHCSIPTPGDFCEYTANQTDSCKLRDTYLGSSTKNCGIPTAGECIADPASPGGAKCRKVPNGPVAHLDCGKVTECK
ncbi:hypothetical protein SH449x_004206 [Pirellulaceae bacterium SH449]